MTKREIFVWMLGFLLGVPTGMLILAVLVFISRTMMGMT